MFIHVLFKYYVYPIVGGLVGDIVGGFDPRQTTSCCSILMLPQNETAAMMT